MEPVDAARVSKDGLADVSDRGKRVQVFRLDGTDVLQAFIGRECKAPECGNGSTAASTAFSTDAAQRYLFVGNRSQAKVMIFERRWAAAARLVRRVGLGPGSVRHPAPHGRRFEGQSLCDRGHAASPGEPAGTEVCAHRIPIGFTIGAPPPNASARRGGRARARGRGAGVEAANADTAAMSGTDMLVTIDFISADQGPRRAPVFMSKSCRMV